MHADQTTIYSALSGLQGALLGFVLAALTIVLGYSQSDRFAVVREAGQLQSLFNVYLAGVRTSGIAVTLTVVGLLADTHAHSRSVITGVVLAICLLTVLRLVRVLWVTNLVVHAVAQPAERQAGAAS